MGRMKGISTNVSRRFSHLDLPLAINHAKGKPAITSINETKRAISKDAETPAKAGIEEVDSQKLVPVDSI